MEKKITQFESKDARINREVNELHADNEALNADIEANMNRFDMKMNNGAKIGEEDVRNLFSGILKKHNNNVKMSELLNKKGVDMDVKGIDEMINEAADEAAKFDDWKKNN